MPAIVRKSLGVFLVAPTWRGPLPTMTNGHRPFFHRLCSMVDLPVLGPLLCKLNVVRHMARTAVMPDCPASVSLNLLMAGLR